jgi:hypothetical protein
MLLLFIKLLSLAGCKLFWADGTEILLNPPVVFVELEPISDDESPGLLSAFSIDDVPSVDLGMA